jgi:hypothetical protein
MIEMLSKEHHSPNVGAGLPAMAVVQLRAYQLVGRYRKQANSHG